MKYVMCRLPNLVTASAAFALAASLGAAAGAAEYGQRNGYQYQVPPSADERPPAAPEVGVPASQAPGNTCFYLNYDPTAPMGQGSGSGLGRARLVCR
jgi:hypothetical protein